MGPGASWVSDALSLRAIRSRLLNSCLIYFAIVCPLALIASVLRSWQHGWSPIYPLHIGLAVLVILGAAMRGRLPCAVRACLLLGLAGLPAFGLVGGLLRADRQ